MSASVSAAARHAGLAAGRWGELSLLEQLANIGSEVGRATHAKAVSNEPRFANALDRCLELFDLTMADPRWQGRRREIARAREVVCDFLIGDNAYGSTPEALDGYFLAFARAVSLGVQTPGDRQFDQKYAVPTPGDRQTRREGHQPLPQ